MATAQAENDRVHEHFVRVESLVGARDVRSLDPGRRLARALLLDELTHYRSARRFPLNSAFPGKAVPCFIDEAGTRCAVAHLLEMSGQGELAESIARRRNYARVR